MSLTIQSPRIYTKLGVAISVVGVAQVKIVSTDAAGKGDGKNNLRLAGEMFLGMSTDQVKNLAGETLEGHQRAIMGTMTVEEIYQDRQKFSAAVINVAVGSCLAYCVCDSDSCDFCVLPRDFLS